jgi:Tfp pilus assembly protein PilW
MTTITPSRTEARPARIRAGFTLVEILIGATMSTMILAGVLSTFLFLGRSGVNVQNYNDMEAQARKALEYFAEDVRQASAIAWSDSTTLTLTVNSASVVYTFSSSDKTFYRRDAAGTKALVTGVTQFQFKGYTITGAEITDLSTTAARASAGKVTKQLQISLEAARASKTVVAATNTVLSARFILRNKIVTA